jgi:predicted HTH transcriptional regulator
LGTCAERGLCRDGYLFDDRTVTVTHCVERSAGAQAAHDSHLPQTEVIENALRTKAKLLPDDALREVIANALVHQDFTESGTSVMIEIYSDRREAHICGPFRTASDRSDDCRGPRPCLLSAQRLRVAVEKAVG